MPDKARRSARPTPSSRGLEVGVRPADNMAPARRTPPVAVREPSRTARGPILQSIDAEIERRYGEEARERVVALLPDDHAEELRVRRPGALDAHDIDLVRLYADLASKVLGLDAAAFTEMGRSAALRELSPFVKTLVLPARLPDAMQRVAAILGRTFEFGAWSVVRSMPELARLRVEGYASVTAPLRAFFLGVVEAVLRRSVSPDVRVVEVTQGGTAPDVFEIEVSFD